MKTKQLTFALIAGIGSLLSVHLGKYIIDGHHYYSAVDGTMAFITIMTTMLIAGSLQQFGCCAFKAPSGPTVSNN